MFLSQLICLIPPTLLWIHKHESNSIFGIHKESGNSLWDGKCKLSKVLIKLCREKRAFGFRELDLDIDSVLPPSGRHQIIFVTRTLTKRKKKEREPGALEEAALWWSSLMLEGSMYKRNQSKKAFKFYFRIKVRFFFFSFFFNSCISGILDRKDKNWQRNREKNHVIW